MSYTDASSKDRDIVTSLVLNIIFVDAIAKNSPNIFIKVAKPTPDV